ncbi:MAG: glycosyltransferase family 2 protein [Gemmatimonadota bacterium]
MTIAVVIAAYNAAEWIAEALESVAAQSRPADELIVVDDGSTDDTAAKVEEWQGTASLPVRLLRQPNAGLSAARNRAVLAAASEYIALLDADDLLLPHHLATLERAFALRSGLVLSFGNAERTTIDGCRADPYLAGKAIERLAFEEVAPGVRVISESVFPSLIYGSFIPCCGTLFSRAASCAIGLWDEGLRTANDRDFWLRLSRAGGFAYTPEVVAVVRYHDANLTHARHAVRNARNRLRVVRKMERLAESLGLTPEERASTRAALTSHEQDYLYRASLSGFTSYVRALGELTTAGSLSGLRRPRHLVRALRATLR